MMRNRALAILFFLLTAAYAAADDKGLDVRPAGREFFEIAPREIVTAAFRVTNTTRENRLLISEIELPEGWKLIAEDFPFELGANESITKMVSFFVPETTSQGRYKIKYLVHDREYPSVHDFYTIDVVVLPAKPEKKQPEISQYVVAGEEYKIYFLIINKSETEDIIYVSVDSSENVPFTVDTNNFRLGPSQSKIITVTIKPDAKIAKTFKHNLRVTARIGRPDEKPETRVGALHSIYIIPREENAAGKRSPPIEEQDTVSQPAEEPNNQAILTLSKKISENSNSINLEHRSEGNLKFILGPKDAKELLETESRRVVTAVFRVTNPTDTRKEFVPEVRLPEGWVLIIKDLPFELNPNRTTAKLISFFVPQTTLAGQYEITYLIKDRKYPSVSDFYTVYVKVLPVSRLKVELLQPPKFVIAGEEYRCSFAVTNEGNAESKVNAKVSSGEDIPYTIDVEKFKLAPGQSQTVTVSVKTDPKATKGIKHLLQLTAEEVLDGKVRAQNTAANFTEIIPRIAGVADRFHRIPTEVTFRYISEKNEDRTSGFQTEVRGEGTLDEEGKKHVKFRFRGPDVQDKSIFGERDEYTLNYWTKDHELNFGDNSYSVSALTESYLYGRGLEGKLHFDEGFSLGAYHMNTRWVEPAIEETAAYIDYSINDTHTVGLNYLRKNKDGKISDIASFEGEFKPFRNTQLELEYALGPGGTGKDNAYLTRFYGCNNWFSYYLKLIHAGPDYPGYYSDLDFISGGITLPVKECLKLNASFRQEKNNLDLNPVFYSAASEKYYQLGLDYKLQTDTTFSFDLLTREHRDRLDSPKFDYQDDTFRFGIGQSFEKLTFNTFAELGKTKNRLESETSRAERYDASVYFKPDSKQSYSGYIYYDKNSDFTGENKSSTTVGLSAHYKISNRTFFNFGLQTNNSQGTVHGDRDTLELGLSHAFINNNKLSVTARQTRYKSADYKDDTSLMVQYTVPLGLPVSIKKSTGSVLGYIYNEDTQNSIGNAILRLNDLTVISDNGGNFVFPSLKPGMYYLNVDTSSIGTNRIPNLKTPIELLVKGGERTIINIPVTQAVCLMGRVMVYRYENNFDKASPSGELRNIDESRYVFGNDNSSNSKLIEDYGLVNVIIELKNNTEIKRVITDRQGYFEFKELRPGIWTLKIYNNNLPEYHYLEKDTFELELKPGQITKVSVKVLPMKRRIRIISEPQNLFEEKQK